jgi:hypothetical protein
MDHCLKEWLSHHRALGTMIGLVASIITLLGAFCAAFRSLLVRLWKRIQQLRIVATPLDLLRGIPFHDGYRAAARLRQSLPRL